MTNKNNKKVKIKLLCGTSFKREIVGIIGLFAFVIGLATLMFFSIFNEWDDLVSIVLPSILIPLILFGIVWTFARVYARNIVVDYATQEVLVHKGVFHSGFFPKKKYKIPLASIVSIRYKLYEDFHIIEGRQSTGRERTFTRLDKKSGTWRMDRHAIKFILDSGEEITCCGYANTREKDASGKWINITGKKTKEVINKLSDLLETWQIRNSICHEKRATDNKPEVIDSDKDECELLAKIKEDKARRKKQALIVYIIGALVIIGGILIIVFGILNEEWGNGGVSALGGIVIVIGLALMLGARWHSNICAVCKECKKGVMEPEGDLRYKCSNCGRITLEQLG
ncbi:MAG: hypothetical protein FWD82_00345 [Defluviitaleaceae bacterium]|nr:hypothetical protein [Defluviitaleaceae bacterium]